MSRSSRTHLPSRIPSLLPSSSKPPAPATGPPQPLQPPRGTRLLHRRRLRNPAFPGRRLGLGGAAAGAGAGGRRSGPTTPLLRWKFDDADLSGKPAGRPHPGGAKARRKPEVGAGAGAGATAAGPVSARRLAAGIWQLQRPEISVPVKSVAARPVHGHLQSPHFCKLNTTGIHKDRIDVLRSPLSVPNLNNGVVSSKLGDHAALPYSAMERATKWDPGFPKASDEVFRFYSHLKLLEDQQVTTVSVVSALQDELEGARARINELEAERRLSKKKLDHFLKKLSEEKASWRMREHEKVRAVIDDMRDALNREKKNRQRMEIVNSKLVNELAEVKLSAKRYLQDYEKERKARELVEEVCDELAKEIGEDKAEVEALKRESMKIREEVEEERRMLQMAEVWREERVQMKLIDAKLILEEKYSQLSKLQSDLEAFLKARSSFNSDVTDIKEAELLRDAADSVKVQEVKEFVYQPPTASEDIFSVFEELHPGEETNEREIEPCYGYSPASRASKVLTVSPEINGFIEKPINRYPNGTTGRDRGIEDDSGWETMSPAEEQGSSNSPDGSDPSGNGFCESNASGSGTDWEDNAEDGNANSEISEVLSSTTKQSRKKMSSIARLWRSSSPNNGEKYKIMSVEAANGRLSNGRTSNGTLSPDVGLGEAGLDPMNVGEWSSPDSVNPHITRGMKGCIEWPRGMQKHSLKSKLLEARMESQKIQLRHVLKQKI